MYEWADNAIKLNIAKGKGATEQEVYEAYVKLGGRTTFTPEFVQPIAIEEEVPDVTLVVEETKPKKESVVKKAIKKVTKKK